MIPHYHCPGDCDHVQPICLPDGRMVCGEAWVMQHVAIELIECTPETCPEDVAAGRWPVLHVSACEGRQP